MNTHYDLYAEICKFENIFYAYRKARKGKRNRPEVADFEFNQERELIKLQQELIDQTWKPGHYHSFYIHEPKRRLISAAPFRDRVVHHALCNIIEPIWEKRFVSDSYANRIGKGTHRAILRASQFAKRYCYVLQCDLEQYFPSIDHFILRQKIEKVIRDEKVINLIQKILDSGAHVLKDLYVMKWFSGDNFWAVERKRGLPIGNLTSQFWGNVYLNSFDHFVKRELRCPAYLRYVDDFLLFADDKRTLWAWKDAIVNRLEKFRLTLHLPQVFPTSTGIPFLGFRIYPEYRRLKKRKGIAFQRHFSVMYKRWLKGEITRKKLDESARSWAAHASWGNTYGLRKKLLGQYDFFVK